LNHNGEVKEQAIIGQAMSPPIIYREPAARSHIIEPDGDTIGPGSNVVRQRKAIGWALLEAYKLAVIMHQTVQSDMLPKS